VFDIGETESIQEEKARKEQEQKDKEDRARAAAAKVSLGVSCVRLPSWCAESRGEEGRG
jgi:hypothetical protein